MINKHERLYQHEIMSEIKQFTSHEVSDHNESKDLYIIIHNKVYDCSSWVENHPCVPSYRARSYYIIAN